MEVKKRKGVLIAGISVLVLLVVVGVSFAFWNYAMVGENQLLVAGDIYMKFTEGNKLDIENALPIDINNYYFEKDEFTTNVSESDITMCTSLFSSMLEGFEDLEGFCKGTTAYQGMYIKDYLDSQGLTSAFKSVLPSYFITNNYFDASPKVSTYTVNSNMNTEELENCKSFFDEFLSGGGSGGGPSAMANALKQMASGGDSSSSNSEKICKGESVDGMNFQNLLDSKYLSDEQIKKLVSQNILIENIREYPTLKYLEYTIEGKNTYDKDITYEVLLQYGADHATRTERLKDKLLKFRLAEVIDGEEKEIFTNRSYEELDNTKMYIDTIPAQTNKKITKTYRLYMWISNETVIGVGDNIDYDMDTWNNKVFASVKLQVNGDFEEKNITYDKEVATTKIKNTLGKGNGVIGLNSKSEKVTTASSDIREYRYSGPVVNNYVYYNCEDENNQTKDTCEIWRIVGVFSDESGEHLKIVKNSILEGTKLPATYTVSGREYNIANGPAAYWNNPTDENYNNDWTTAGLQYYLNSESDDNGVNKGYLSYLKDYSKNMIEETTYYLGNITYGRDNNSWYIIDTPKQAYKNERSNLSCSDEYECDGGHIWPDNQATWKGKVTLLYPSDYGFSASSTYWDTKLGGGSFIGTPASSSWLFTTANPVGEWLLSPSSDDPQCVAFWFHDGAVGYNGVYYNFGVRPTFNLISSVMIGPGSGAKMDPYWLMGE